MVDSFQQIWGRVLTLCPAAGPLLAQRWTIDAFRRIAERRRWSWLVKTGQFIIPAAYTTGTVTLVQGNNTVTGSGTTWTAAMVGRQFRVGLATPVYTITEVNSATSLQLDLAWGGTSTSGVGYQIYLCYVTPAEDFHQFISVWDPNYSWQLGLDVTQTELNSWDAQRANTGQAYLVASFDYSQNLTGTVLTPVEIIGSGPGPSISGSSSYTGPANSIFTVQIVLGGASGTATFRWNKDNGSFTTVTTDAASQDLQNGVSIFFPTAVTYIAGDTFVIRTSVVNSPGLPRYELWPANLGDYVYPYLYEARCQDLNEPGAVLPRYIRGDVVMDVALSMAAQWPGPSVDNPNAYYDLNLADRIMRRTETAIGEMERQDDETYENMVSYASSLQFSPYWDSKFIQSHALL